MHSLQIGQWKTLSNLIFRSFSYWFCISLTFLSSGPTSAGSLQRLIRTGSLLIPAAFTFSSIGQVMLMEFLRLTSSSRFLLLVRSFKRIISHVNSRNAHASQEADVKPGAGAYRKSVCPFQQLEEKNPLTDWLVHSDEVWELIWELLWDPIFPWHKNSSQERTTHTLHISVVLFTSPRSAVIIHIFFNCCLV